MSRVYLSPPHMSGSELELVSDAIASNWVAPLGPHVEAFERELASFVGIEHACALSSGTAALHLALILLGVGAGDEVFTSTLTFAASANAITYVGARPVFIDCDRRSWNMDPNLLEATLRERARLGRLPKAVLVVDLYGQCADHQAVGRVCRELGVPIIEDAAEALGATYDGRQAGSFGDIAAFSFNGNKIITTSGGGMLVSQDKNHAERARFLATQARDPAPHYEHSHIGYNYRLSNVLAAIGRAQLRVLPERVERRRQVFARYQAALDDLPGLSFMPEAPYGRSTRWLTCVQLGPEFGATPEELRLHLERQNIEARPVWKPMHLQPAFAGADVLGGEVSKELFERGMCLPSGSSLTESDQDRVIEIVRASARG